MNCEQARPLIPPGADGELDALRLAELEAHLRDCPACAKAWGNLRSLKQAVRQDAVFFHAPEELRRRIRQELRSEAGDRPARWFGNWNWLATSAGGAAFACLALWIGIMLSRPPAPERLVQELAANHIRSLMANHALDVASSDQHTVKPWFDGRLDFSPPVPDPAPREFPLTGGRLDYVDGRAVAALVYQRHKHVINVFIWPAREADSAPRAAGIVQGYNLVHWMRADMSFWAISDLNEKELEEFARTLAP